MSVPLTVIADVVLVSVRHAQCAASDAIEFAASPAADEGRTWLMAEPVLTGFGVTH